MEVRVYGSVGGRGGGEMRDVGILDRVEGEGGVEIVWKGDILFGLEGKGMSLKGLDGEKKKVDEWSVLSVGGGGVGEEGEEGRGRKDI